MTDNTIYQELFPSSRPRRLRRSRANARDRLSVLSAGYAPFSQARYLPTYATCSLGRGTRLLCKNPLVAPRSDTFPSAMRRSRASARLFSSLFGKFLPRNDCIRTLPDVSSDTYPWKRPLPGRVRDADSSCRVAEPGPSGRIAAVLRFLQTRRRPFLSGGIRQKWRTTSALSPLVLPGMRNAGASRPRRRTPRNDVPSADDFARAPASGSAARRV